MKKKLIVLSIVAVLVLSIGMFAYAESTEEAPQWFKDMIVWKKDQVGKALEAGEITEEQANAYNERFESMEKYHEENGFGFPGSCHEGGFGRNMRKGFGNKEGFRNGFGMMRGF